MDILKFVIFKQANFVRLNYENVRVEANKLMAFRDEYDVLMSGEFIEVTCTMQQLLDSCDTLCEYLSDYYCCYERNSFRILDFPCSAQKTLDFSLNSDKGLAIHYIIHYCLSRDWGYFSEMFFSMINEGGELIGFMRKYAFNSWPVERYASMLGISLRKFNFLFKSRFCVSPKHWLIETRLVRARHLLSCSAMSVAEVAEHCGFSNHAYFSESFRKRFSCSPSQWRNRNLLNVNQSESEENYEP